MKKMVAVILCLVVFFSLALTVIGCGGGSSESSSSASESASQPSESYSSGGMFDTVEEVEDTGELPFGKPGTK